MSVNTLSKSQLNNNINLNFVLQDQKKKTFIWKNSWLYWIEEGCILQI